MDLKAVVLLACLYAFTIPSVDAGIPKCCVTTSKQTSLHVLKNVVRWDVQQSNGACDIRALVLYVRGWKKPVCAHPKVKRKLIRIQKKLKGIKPKSRY